ncbi:transcriptional regulator SlyA [Alteromonas sp. 14N.309.X.WAT.G.H12]|uniref:transcriptional regulator SlyA n=1 Tax=Alteromonas sp. 14N.309.X.WAT.G.H12 TaxID=3120824 RepID=UPI002FD61FE2
MENNIGWHLSRAAYAWRQAVDHFMSDLNLTQTRWVALLHLDRTGEGCSQKELAEDIGVEQPSLLRTLNLLEEADLIERKPCAEDARIKTLWFTPKGRQLMEAVEERAKAARLQMLNGFDENECKQLYLLLSRVIDNANNFFSKEVQ